MQRRYAVVCDECGEIEADTSDDGLFEKATAHRRAGHHEGAFDHHCTVEVAEEELTDEEEWEQNNQGFRYEAPEKPGEMWTSEEMQELRDRHITRRKEWFCDLCTGRGPIGTLRKARRHMESHTQKLLEKHETPREDLEAATDGGQSTDDTPDSCQNSLTDYGKEEDTS